MSFSLRKKSFAILASFLLLVAPTIYLWVERYASRLHTPSYSYLENHTSDLGIPYAYIHPRTGHLTNSWRANAMNLNFVVNGFLYLAGHVCLLKATAQQTGGKLSKARLNVAVLYCIGIILVAAFPGGPREFENGTAILHGLGALLAIGGGDLNCLLAGLAMPRESQPIYRACSILLGATGLVGLPLIQLFDSSSMRGFWQRLSIYPVQTWEYTTAISLIIQLMEPAFDTKQD